MGLEEKLLIDMHNHTMVSSNCSLLRPEELIEEASRSPLDAICVTEHSKLEGAEITRGLGSKYSFPVFRGIEARTDLGDMLVFGWYQDIPDDAPLAQLCEEVLAAGGAIFAAHPFHTRGGWNLYTALKQKGLDLLEDWERIPVLRRLTGIEIINGNVEDQLNDLARNLASQLGIYGIGGSDAHSRSMVGRAATLFSDEIQSETELVKALKSGNFEAVRLR